MLTITTLGAELLAHYEPVQPMEFYRDIFPLGELGPWRDKGSVTADHDYTGIIVRVKQDHVERYTVTDDLDAIDGMIWDKERDFCIMAPISYAGKSRKSINARFMYALVVEIDNLRTNKDVAHIADMMHGQVGLCDLMHQIDNGVQPRPTYIVSSGNGLHLYYVFEQPIALFPNIVKELSKYKRALTYKLWNKYVTDSYKKNEVQQESIFQGFRMVGTVTKNGRTVEAYRTGDKVTMEYMNGFVSKQYQFDAVYKSNLTLAKAKELYPEWYERRVVQGQPKGHWICKRDLYDWWLRRIKNETVVGHRYYCMMMLCIYAIKCDISQEELEKDCMDLLTQFESMTKSDDNHFTIKDVMDALQAFEDKTLITYPIASISNRSGLEIVKNKRNGRKQADHIKLMNYIRDEINGNTDWRNKDGRPTAKKQVLDWRAKNPNGKKADCIRDTGLTKPTVYKWWDALPDAGISKSVFDTYAMFDGDEVLF